LTSTNATSLSQQTVFTTPVSRLLPRIRLRTRQAPALIGQKILVTIDRWDATSRYPEGHFVRALGKVESKEAEQESLLLEFEVPYRPFGKAVLDCLPVEGDQWVVPPKTSARPEWKDREDLRGLLICSIDPPGKWMRTKNRSRLVNFGRYQDVKTLMMHCMPGSCRMGTSRLVFVSALDASVSPELSCSDNVQILPTCPISSILIPPWIARQPQGERRYIWWTNGLTCCLLYLAQISVLSGRMSNVWHSQLSGYIHGHVDFPSF
jgi:hypothetical protein